MIVLGINEDHNASAALVVDGEVVACASEERFVRIKNDVGYPREAINFVLSQAGVQPEDCDRIVYASYEQDPVHMKIKRITRFTIKDYVREMYEYWKPVLLDKTSSSFWDDIQKEERLGHPDGVHYNFSFLENTQKEDWADAFRKERQLVVSRHLGVPTDKVIFVDHHTSHAHYAYFAAPINRSRRVAVVTADGWGDGCNATISIAQGNTIKEVHRTSHCNLARVYRFVTLALGLRPNEHEYKVMGLAPYAHDEVKRPAYEMFKETLVVDGLDFKWHKRPADLYFHFKEQFEREGVRFDGIAGGIQQWIEEMIGEWISNILKELDADCLVMSGGLAMNVKANQVIAELPQVKDFFVAPGPGDESLCMGAAFVVCSQTDEIKPLRDAYLGPSPTACEARAALDQFSAHGPFEVITDPTPDQVAGFLAEGKVLARCVGRMEFGPRALGNRSILCDPSKWDNVRKINEKIKFRDFWMPFTPSMLSERANDYLLNPKSLKSPFMTTTFDSTELAQKHLAAAIHPYDFTVRPQIVEPESNPDYYALIKAFEAKTGIGAVLNTSFNLHGQPVVCTATDAMDTLVNSGLDGLVLPGVLVLKRPEAQ